jgi:hypothetical protein
MTNSKFKPVLELMFSLTAFAVAFSTMQGTLQKHVAFADPLNEMFFCVGALMIGFMYLYLGVSNTYDALKNK